MSFLNPLTEPEEPLQQPLVPVEGGKHLAPLEQDDTVELNIKSSVGKSADEYAKALDLSRETGIHVDSVVRNKERIQSKVNYNNLNLDKIREDAPVLWNVLKDRQRAAVMHDDLGFFETIEQTWKDAVEYGSHTIDSHKVGRNNVRTSELRMKDLWSIKGLGDPLTTEEKAEIAQMKGFNATVHKQGEELGLVAGTLPATSEQLPILFNIISGGIKYGAAGAVLGATAYGGAALIAGQIPPFTAAPEEIVTVPATAMVGAIKVGGASFKIGNAVAAFNLEAGLALDEFRDLEDVDENLAADAAIVVGIVNAGLEMVSLSFLGKTMTPAKRILMNRIKKAMVTETGREVIQSLAGRYMAAVASEGITEFFQEYMNIAGSEFLQVFGNKAYTDDKMQDVVDAILTDENFQRAGEAFVKGAQASTIISGGGITISATAEHYSKKIQSVDEQSRIDKVADAVSDSKTKDRDTDLIREYMQKVMDEYGGDDTVFIPVTDLELADIEEFEGETFELIREQFEEAKSTGADIVIPMPSFAADVMTNEQAYSTLRDHIRLSTNTLTNKEAANIDEEHKERVQRIVEEAAHHEEQLEEADKIWQQVTQELVETGRQPEKVAKVSSTVIPAYVTTRATREGLTVSEVYQRMGIKIIGPQEELPVGDKVILDQYKGTQVTTMETIEETGDTVEITESGDVAFTRTQERVSSLDQMINCLQS